MSQRTRMDHLVRTLQQQGFYPRGLVEYPGCINEAVLDAIKEFLKSSKGRPVRVVVNAFRNISKTFAGQIDPIDHVTFEVRRAVNAFVERNKKEDEKDDPGEPYFSFVREMRVSKGIQNS
ncbi:MAG: hypothetical protein PF549_02385 [Patescibacteria group bacterium]|jgi:hypothetical protein|nr:hypothetical protein [Patescibacteria group bacterium]